MKVAILILNFNGKHLLLSYLDSIVSKKEDAEIWVIDNGSTDDSIDVIKNKFSDFKIFNRTQKSANDTASIKSVILEMKEKIKTKKRSS